MLTRIASPVQSVAHTKHALGAFWLFVAALIACSRVEPEPPAPETNIPQNHPEPTAFAAASSAPMDDLVSPVLQTIRLPALTEPYPRGRWRLGQAKDLAGVLLWVSHILVRHRDVPAGQLSFEVPQWTSAPPAPDRTREAAFALARELAMRVSGQPDRFEDVAREASEDVATRDVGGSLGAYSALRFSAWPKVLDAIASLEPGQTSRVVETEFGFHVLKRRPPPREMHVSASRIIIGHDDAPWLRKHVARGDLPRRSRADALALATDVFRRALAAPGEFSRLARDYSEHKEAVRDGDFGRWSTREPTPFRQAIEIASQLEVGGIAPPVDSLFGYQIIQRTTERARVAYQMRNVTIPFQDGVPDSDPRSRASAFRTAARIADRLRTEPSRFDEFERQFCCSEARGWIEGRGSARIEQALSLLEPGEISRGIIEDEASFWIVQRVEARAFPPPPLVRFDLPAPERADVEYLVVRSNWIETLNGAAKRVEPLLDLDPTRARRFAALHDIAGRLQAAPSKAERHEVYRNLQRELEALLGLRAYGRYATSVESYFREKLIGDSAPF
jgi:hypothetical protein